MKYSVTIDDYFCTKFFLRSNIKSTCVPVKYHGMAKEFHGYDYFRHYNEIDAFLFGHVDGGCLTHVCFF